MPSISGGDSSGRDYAPHMYVLTEGGNPNKDADYAFVGDAVASAYDELGQEYRMGVTALDEAVCEVSREDTFLSCQVPTGIPCSAIPESVKRGMLGASLSQIATTSGQVMLRALGVDVPKDIEPLDFKKMFDGSTAERAAEADKSKQWDAAERQLRTRLDIDSSP